MDSASSWVSREFVPAAVEEGPEVGKVPYVPVIAGGTGQRLADERKPCWGCDVYQIRRRYLSVTLSQG